jgi:acyl-CoA synthetase (AMP-forming)/AMP-acid ligase II
MTLPGVEAAIMGEEQPGSLFTRMQAPFLGYLSSDTIDASRVSPDGWYSTGDFATQAAEDTEAADGWITITGRIGQGLRRGGRFIQPAEVERVLKSHPDVADVVIIGGRDAYGEDVIEAHLEAWPGHQLSVEVLRQYAMQALESYKLPTVWQFYATLPRTSGGKPDRLRLSRQREE